MAKRLKTHGDVRRFMSWAANQVVEGKMDPNVGAKLSYMCNTILKSLDACDTEERLKRLEERYGDQLGTGGT